MPNDPQAALLEMIREAQGGLADDGTITTRELAKLMGCGIEKARETIRDLIASGKMEPCRSNRVQCTGIVCTTWAYRMVS